MPDTLAVVNSLTAAERATMDRPPPLEYSLRTRKLSISVFWTLVVVDIIVVPLALYFGLRYHTKLSNNAVFSISTGVLGTVSVYEYVLRFWRLWKKDSTCRVIGASKRTYLDWFHWNFSAGWLFVMAELIVGTSIRDPPMRVLAMPVASMLFAFSIQFLVVDGLRLAGVPAPVRISSLPVGAPMRPSVYSIVEDIVAVDGCGGTAFRERLNRRYEASRPFRTMLHRLTLFWASGALATATVTTVLVWTIKRERAYVVGWTLPFLWAGVWTIITTKWVQHDLRREEVLWKIKTPGAL